MNKQNGEIITVKNFDELPKSGKVVIDCFATWCGPCKQFAPIFEEVSGERNNLKFYKVDVDESEEIASRFGIMSIPTILLLQDGQEINRNIGAMNKEQFLNFIDGENK